MLIIGDSVLTLLTTDRVSGGERELPQVPRGAVRLLGP